VIKAKNKTKKLSFKLIKYEVVNLTSNIFVLIFGVIFPIGMALLAANVFVQGVEGEARAAAHTGIFIALSFGIPLATMLMGHAANYANELELGTVQRFKLFGFSDKTMLFAKMIAKILFLMMSFVLYTFVLFLTTDVVIPSAGAAFIFLAFFLIFSIALFLLGHAIASLCGQFGKTFGIVMGVYFFISIFGSSMGINPSMFPDGMRHVSMAFPVYYLNTYFNSFWAGGSFENWVWFLVTSFAFAVVSAGLYLIAMFLTKKGKIKQDAKPAYWD